MLPPTLLAVLLLTAFLALIPARRLFLSGHSSGVVAVYFLSVWLLGIAAVETRGRLLVPIVLILYVLPFVTWRAGVNRLLRRAPADDAGPPARPVFSASDPDTPSGLS